MAVVGAVVVTFRPELGKLSRLLDRLGRQVDSIVVVDNGPDASVGEWMRQQHGGAKASYIPLLENVGIAAAQNRGIRHVLERGVTHVVLFDQDSAPDPTMVTEMLEAEERLLRASVEVGALGPRLYDERTRRPLCFVQFRRGVKRLVDPEKCREELIETHHLVASGTMIRRSVLERVGLMREELFLEYVDVEWGLRARALGYRSFGVKAAGMLHNLGERRATVLFGARSVPLHAPLRHYYTMRNSVFMARLPYVPLYWKAQDALRTALGFVFYSLGNAPRRQQLIMMLRGFAHGFRGRMGRFAG
jgi:rhamnosyltransferase